jgi:hypothetical protein
MIGNELEIYYAFRRHWPRGESWPRWMVVVSIFSGLLMAASLVWR